VVAKGPNFAQKVGGAWTEAVRKHIQVVQRTDLFAAIDVAANRARSSRVVLIVQNWINLIWWFGSLIACVLNKTFTDPPPVVFASTRIRVALHVHLLAIMLPPRRPCRPRPGWRISLKLRPESRQSQEPHVAYAWETELAFGFSYRLFNTRYATTHRDEARYQVQETPP
jgi:hypothetical protein